MSAIWAIEALETTEGSSIVTAHWRATDGDATAYGSIGIDGVVITPKTLEQEVVARVKATLNAAVEKYDEDGNPVPPMPGAETAATDAIEAELARQLQELAHPKKITVSLPWKV